MMGVVRAMPWWLLATAVLLIDFLTKEVVRLQLPLGTSIPLTPFFNLVSIRNSGAAFSFLADAGGWQRYFFILLAIAIGVVLVWMLTRPQRTVDAVAFSLILGGAAGNTYDRVVFAAVTDFLDFYIGGWHWPAFNGADIAICVGALTIVCASFSTTQPAGRCQPRT